MSPLPTPLAMPAVIAVHAPAVHAPAVHAAVDAPWPAEQLRHFERRLLEERARARRALTRLGLRPTDDEGEGHGNRIPDHLADVGHEAARETVDASIASRESEALAEIDAALRRLYRAPDRFGRDERTGARLSFDRLDLIPWARHAVRAPRAPGRR